LREQNAELRIAAWTLVLNCRSEGRPPATSAGGLRAAREALAALFEAEPA
jgi:hypothetical protein